MLRSASPSPRSARHPYRRSPPGSSSTPEKHCGFLRQVGAQHKLLVARQRLQLLPQRVMVTAVQLRRDDANPLAVAQENLDVRNAKPDGPEGVEPHARGLGIT